jgi:hypothetical protein
MYLRWFILRMALPATITAVVTWLMWGGAFFNISFALLWSTFIAHILVTVAFRRTHVLDTGSFFCLLFCLMAIAEIGESQGNRWSREWIIATVAFAAYALLSFIGRYRASQPVESSSIAAVSSIQVIVAVGLLVLAVVVCSTSKTAVGFLFVPAIIGLPLILAYSLFKRGKSEKGRARS